MDRAGSGRWHGFATGPSQVAQAAVKGDAESPRRGAGLDGGSARSDLTGTPRPPGDGRCDLAAARATTEA